MARIQRLEYQPDVCPNCGDSVLSTIGKRFNCGCGTILAWTGNKTMWEVGAEAEAKIAARIATQIAEEEAEGEDELIPFGI